MTNDHTPDLDRLLAAWTSATRLGDDEAATMFRAVVAEPRPRLSITWWQDLHAQVTAAVVQATAAGPVAAGHGSLPHAA